MKCTDLLVQEHKVILRGLEVLERMAERVDQDQPVEEKDVKSLLRFLRAFADDNHQLKEESALFPELMRTSAANESRLRQMIFEHDQERSLVEGLEDALYTKKGKEFVLFGNRLVGLIRSHILREDSVLFGIAEGSLSAEQDENVMVQLERFQTEAALMEELERLEWTYLRRAA